MKLVSTLKKSKKVIKKETEIKKPTWLNVQITGKDCVMTPQGIYRFSLRTIEIDLKVDYVMSIVRESYNGNREHVRNIMTNDLNALENWIRDMKKSIINKDFKDRKYIMPYYEI